MQAGSLYVSLLKAESYASEARLRGKNLSDSNDKSTYRSGQYTLVYLSTLLILPNSQLNSKNDTRNADDTQQNHALTGMGVVSLP